MEIWRFCHLTGVCFGRFFAMIVAIAVRTIISDRIMVDGNSGIT